MASQRYWHLFAMLIWILQMLLPLCLARKAPRLLIFNTAFVAFTGEDLYVHYELNIPANQSKDVLTCFDPEQRQILRHEVAGTPGHAVSYKAVLDLKMLINSGEYHCRYKVAKVYWFLRLRVVCDVTVCRITFRGFTDGDARWHTLNPFNRTNGLAFAWKRLPIHTGKHTTEQPSFFFPLCMECCKSELWQSGSNEGYREVVVEDYTDFMVVAFFSGVLLVFSVVSSVYVFRGTWKQQMPKCGNPSNDRKQNKEQTQAEKPEGDTMSVIITSSTSLYASLEPRPRSIYDVLERSAVDKPAPKPKTGQRPVEQRTPAQDEGVFESVYENF
ncbi:uncharacterized protein si:ch211-243a20.4 isoform X2 [Phyllopteryx taeniolatus]|uniref:uncharacterized protein si:ch211-243a20.4 isoform X2 n=1 Tax=Phyllopteryx taeniolatus TaxID=161469 RepID=UPI002AD4053A|nr:uncharacterized protein si:ch211-243a20.4 isoform X2 [Phyllopteryx taeniolatus]